LEGGHRLTPPVVAEDELIEVHLELRAANAVMGADQPLLEVADGSQRDDRAIPLAQRAAERLLARHVVVR
jgi:hypothetical protein